MGDEAGQEISAGRRHIIERPRLTRLLDETSARVIMLVAPAGYGKTTLARQWLAHRPHAWYQGSASSGDVAALALGLSEAAEALVSDVGRRLREWLPTSREPEQEVDVIEQFLAEDLADWPDEAWFVVDDYHLLLSEAAEDLIRRLFLSSSRRVLLTSRQRPAWSSARELLYGNFFELGQSSLAMNTEEANAVLASRNTEAASGLVALADGWPAVIGLAALAPDSVMLEEGFPDELHDYFAEELFASLPESTRDGLCRISLVPIVTREAADAILGPEAEAVLAEAREAGMFAAHRTQDLGFHPLLRAFLMRKLLESPRLERAAAVTRATEFLIQAGFWDEAFSLISDFDRHDLLDNLLAQAIIPLTKQGRLATLREWLDYARRAELSSPYLNLAEAEVMFRQGRQKRGGTLARSAASSFAIGDPLLSLAHYRAGQSRHLIDDSSGALRHFEAAYASAGKESDTRNALWGQFIVAFELERNEAFELLDELASMSGPDRDEAVRTECGKLMLAICEGGSIPPAAELVPISDLARDASDPLIRSALLRALAAVLVLGAEYASALDAVQKALREAERFHLDFVRPHTLVSQTAASIGLRRFSDAARILQEIESAARQMNDPYLTANADILRCRLFLSEGSTAAALEAVSGTWSRGPTPARKMEFTATKAAALACAGNPEKALDELRRVEGVSRWLEPDLLFRWTRSMCQLMLDENNADEEVRNAYAATSSSGAFDVFVFINRLHPKILAILGEDPNLHNELSAVLARSNDRRQTEARGLPSDRGRSPDHSLTKREVEVYSLLAEGRSNREIAQALFISEPTVKVHVRNILRKLGARTRTEAAIQAARTQQPRGHAEDQAPDPLGSDPPK